MARRDMIFDTHSHYDDGQFDEDRSEVLKKIGEDCRVVNAGASLKSSRCSVELAESYDFIYAAVGVHPDDSGDLFGLTKDDAERMRSAAEASADGKECGEAGNTAVNGKECGETGNTTTDGKKCGESGSNATDGKVCGETGNTVADGKECGETGTTVSDRGIFENLHIERGIEELRRLAQNRKVVAIGEIGLDYHWDVWPREMQKKAFIAQWELAAELKLPIEIHSRDAAEDTMMIVKEMRRKYPEIKVDMHCYSYSSEHAEEYLKLGLMFGIGGVATFKNAKKLKEILEWLPMDRILLETDCPYMAPEPFRGKRNTSALLTYVAEKIAEIKGIAVEEVYRQTEANAINFFGL